MALADRPVGALFIVRGSPFAARETLDFAAALCLAPCFTPVQTPESNGIAEAFVKTFKRDYARAGCCYSVPADRQVVR
jgi:transposase InsO family protein